MRQYNIMACRLIWPAFNDCYRCNGQPGNTFPLHVIPVPVYTRYSCCQTTAIATLLRLDISSSLSLYQCSSWYWQLTAYISYSWWITLYISVINQLLTALVVNCIFQEFICNQLRLVIGSFAKKYFVALAKSCPYWKRLWCPWSQTTKKSWKHEKITLKDS